MPDVLPSPIPLPDPTAKPDYTSKTFWLNLLMVALSAAFTAVINSMTGTDLLSLKGASPDPTVTVGSISLPTILALLKWAAASPGLLAFINLILRYQTSTAVVPFWKGKPGSVLTPEEISSLKDLLQKRLPMILLASAIMGAAIVYAAPPKAVIVGPTSGIAGELLELDASGSEGATHFLWLASPAIPGRRQVEPLGDGKRARIASFPGTYTYTCIASNADGAGVVPWTVTVPGELPPPGPSPAPPCPGPNPTPGPTPPQPAPIPVPPTPLPTPTPEPSFPAGQFNVAGDVYKQALAIKSPNRAAECRAMAEGFEGVASAAAAGTFDKALSLLTAKAVSQAMIEANRKALPNGYEAWQDFGVKSGTKATELFNAGRLKTGSDWAVLLRETAMGLRAAGVK